MKADHNCKFLALIPDEFPDWMATAAFYVAVQLVEMLLAKRGRHSQDHFRRKEAVRKDFPKITKSYNKLYNASLVARYDSPSTVLPVAQVRSELIEGALQDMIKFADSQK